MLYHCCYAQAHQNCVKLTVMQLPAHCLLYVSYGQLQLWYSPVLCLTIYNQSCFTDQSEMLDVCRQHLYNDVKHLIRQISPAMAT